MKRFILISATLLGLTTVGFAQDTARPKLDPLKLRPVSQKIIDCVTPSASLPKAVERWATIYCTEGGGQLFAYRDGFYGIFPGTPKRFIVNASGFGGGEDEPPKGQKFAGVTFEPVNLDELATWSPGKYPVPAFLAQAKSVFMLTLKIDYGEETQMMVSDPDTDPFWIQPVRKHRFLGQALYIASLGFLENMQLQ